MTDLLCRQLQSDDDIHAAFQLMATLRDRIRADTFLAEVRRQQLQGYELVGGFCDGRLVALAGIRRSHTLARGEHVFVDDLVTHQDHQGRGYGTALMRWIACRTAAEGVNRIYLDARDTAHSFYTRLAFRFLTSVPCWIEVSELAVPVNADAARGRQAHERSDAP